MILLTSISLHLILKISAQIVLNFSVRPNFTSFWFKILENWHFLQVSGYSDIRILRWIGIRIRPRSIRIRIGNTSTFNILNIVKTNQGIKWVLDKLKPLYVYIMYFLVRWRTCVEWLLRKRKPRKRECLISFSLFSDPKYVGYSTFFLILYEATFLNWDVTYCIT